MFKSKMSAAAFVRKTKLIVGLDITVDTSAMNPFSLRTEIEKAEKKALDIVSQTAEYAVAYKFNRQLVLPLGLHDRIPKIIEAIHEQGLLAIMDCKINDIGNTNHWITQYYLDAGFDAVIANPFVGWEGGLDAVFEVAHGRNKAVITLCYMSHPAADEGYGLNVATDKKMKQHERMYIMFAKKALLWEADGVIVGATYPEKIAEVKKILTDQIPIISPGVGAQGASARDAIEAGASYVIAARSICNADDPKEAARNIAEETR